MFIVFLSLEHSKRGKKQTNRDTVYLGCWDATSVTVKCISLQTDDICQFPVRISPERSKGNTMIASVISIRGRRPSETTSSTQHDVRLIPHLPGHVGILTFKTKRS